MDGANCNTSNTNLTMVLPKGSVNQKTVQITGR